MGKMTEKNYTQALILGAILIALITILAFIKGIVSPNGDDVCPTSERMDRLSNSIERNCGPKEREGE